MLISSLFFVSMMHFMSASPNYLVSSFCMPGTMLSNVPVKLSAGLLLPSLTGEKCCITLMFDDNKHRAGDKIKLTRSCSQRVRYDVTSDRHRLVISADYCPSKGNRCACVLQRKCSVI